MELKNPPLLLSYSCLLLGPPPNASSPLLLLLLPLPLPLKLFKSALDNGVGLTYPKSANFNLLSGDCVTSASLTEGRVRRVEHVSEFWVVPILWLRERGMW